MASSTACLRPVTEPFARASQVIACPTIRSEHFAAKTDMPRHPSSPGQQNPPAAPVYLQTQHPSLAAVYRYVLTVNPVNSPPLLDCVVAGKLSVRGSIQPAANSPNEHRHEDRPQAPTTYRLPPLPFCAHPPNQTGYPHRTAAPSSSCGPQHTTPRLTSCSSAYLIPSRKARALREPVTRCTSARTSSRGGTPRSGARCRRGA